MKYPVSHFLYPNFHIPYHIIIILSEIIPWISIHHRFHRYPLVNEQFSIEYGPVEIVDLPWFTHQTSGFSTGFCYAQRLSHPDPIPSAPGDLEQRRLQHHPAGEGHDGRPRQSQGGQPDGRRELRGPAGMDKDEAKQGLQHGFQPLKNGPHHVGLVTLMSLTKRSLITFLPTGKSSVRGICMSYFCRSLQQISMRSPILLKTWLTYDGISPANMGR